MSPYKRVSTVLFDSGQTVQIACVGERVQVGHQCLGIGLEQMMHEVAADEAGPAGDEETRHAGRVPRSGHGAQPHETMRTHRNEFRRVRGIEKSWIPSAASQLHEPQREGP